MSRIRILHTTTYRYLKPVAFGVHRLVVRPREGHDLQVENLLLRINPPGAVSWHRDIYGNSIALVTFSEPSDLLEFSSEATVFRRDHSAPRGLLDAHPETMPVRYSALEEPLVRAYVQSVFPDEADRLRRWARQTFSLQRGDDAAQSVQEINSWIHRSIRYRRREDRGVQSPLETLARESGSCRDMATLLLEIVRTLKLAGRFASGYLESSASFAGRASTHAWMEVYFPEHGWFGCDPSSGEGTSKKHIVTGVSSHPRGVMPVSGVYSGDPRSFVEMNAVVKISAMA